MNDKKLKVGEKRKLEILEAAKTCFLEKGFQNTTMEDVIEKVSLSKGGVYYHYGSTYEMIYDFMKSGIKYRGEKNKTIDTSKLTSLDAITEMMMERIYDENEFKSIYAIFIENRETIKKMLEEYLKNKFPELLG